MEPKNLIVNFALAVVLILSSASCTTNDQSGDNFKVRILYPLSGLGDRSFSDNIYEGVVKAEMYLNFEKTEVMSDDIAEAEQIYTDWIATEAVEEELIIAASTDYADFINDSGCDLKNRKLLFMDYQVQSCENLRNIIYKTFAPSFIAGVAAMQVSANKKAGIIGGMDIDPVNEFIAGFKAGVEYAGGEIYDIKYISESYDGFWSIEKAKEIALTMYEEVDVIFPVAGGSNSGVFEATKAAENCYTFGIDSDQSYWGKTVILGSVVKHLDLSVEEAIADFAENKFEAGTFHMGMEEGKTDFLLNDYFSEQLSSIVENTYHKAIEAEKKASEEI